MPIYGHKFYLALFEYVGLYASDLKGIWQVIWLLNINVLYQIYNRELKLENFWLPPKIILIEKTLADWLLCIANELG